MNIVDLVRFKEKEMIILNLKEVIILYQNFNVFDKENRLRDSKKEKEKFF